MLGSGVQANLLDITQNDQQFSLTFSQAGIECQDCVRHQPVAEDH